VARHAIQNRIGFGWLYDFGIWEVSSERECAIGIEIALEYIMASEDSMASEQVRAAVGLRHG